MLSFFLKMFQTDLFRKPIALAYVICFFFCFFLMASFGKYSGEISAQWI